MRKIILFISILFLLNFVVAEQMICVDFDRPSAPQNLAISGEVGNIKLTWNAATDEPDCSGIDYYIVTRNGIVLGDTNSLSYTDTEDLSVGDYDYTVFAVDKVKHQEGQSIKNEIKVVESDEENSSDDNENSNSGSSSSGSSSSSGGKKKIIVGGESKNSYVCTENWQCGEWEECKNGEQIRTCTDLNSCGTSTEKPAIMQICENETSRNSLTGSAIQGITNFISGPGILILFVLLLGGGLVFKFRKKIFKK